MVMPAKAEGRERRGEGEKERRRYLSRVARYLVLSKETSFIPRTLDWPCSPYPIRPPAPTAASALPHLPARCTSPTCGKS